MQIHPTSAFGTAFWRNRDLLVIPLLPETMPDGDSDMQPLTVQELLDSLRKLIEAGTIRPDYVFGFSHAQADSPGDRQVYPLDPERFAIVDSYPHAPKLVVFFGKAR